MATFKLKFRPSIAEGKPGTLYFQVTHRRSTRTVYTDYHITAEEWDKRTSFIRIIGTPERQAELQLIVSKIRWDCKRLAAFITEREQAMLEYTADDIVSAFRLLPPCQTWFGFIHGITTKKLRIGRLGTAKTYRNALSSFSRFRDGEDMTVDALDAELMNQYEAWLKGRGVKRRLHTSLTTYTGRHTWASAMRDMGTSLSVISKGLGHENLKTTQIYLSSIDTEDVVKANRKMIGKIMRE